MARCELDVRGLGRPERALHRGRGATKRFRDAVARRLGLGQTPWLRRVLQVAITFSLFVFGVIFFRSASVSEAWYIVTHLFHDIGSWGDKHYWKQTRSRTRASASTTTSCGSPSSRSSPSRRCRRCRAAAASAQMLAGRHWAVRWTLYLLLVWIILAYGMYTKVQPFIYFQF